MSENLSLGKKGQYGEIDFSKIRSGIKKDELLKDVDKKLKPVFEQILSKIDSNPNDNMLSRSELEAFFAEIKKLAGEDNTLSKREGKKYELDGEKIGRKGRDALYALLNKLSALSEDVKEITKDKTNPDVEIIEYKNGKIEKVFPDGSRIITIKNGGKTISTTIDKDDVKTEESVTEGDETVTTTYKNNKKTQEVITSSKHSGITTIKYDAEEKPISQVSKKEDGSVEEYEYIDDGNTRSPRLVKIVKDGNTTVYNYDENGIKTGETVTTSDGKNIERTYNEDGKTEVITQNGQPTHTKKYDSEGNYSDSYSEDNTDVTDNYDNQDRHIEQTKVRDGQSYNVRYDENGNTLGVIVQNGETIEDIANKFGVNIKDLIKVNAAKVRGKYPNAYFNVGEEIKIPRKLAADETALQGRQTKEEAIAAYNADAERRAEEARQRAEAEANKPQIVAKGNNGYYVTKDKDGNIRYYDPKGNEISGAEFKKHCPSIYDSVQGIKTRKKYDTVTIQKQADELAEALHSQISGASTNSKTIGLLKTITYENVAFVVASYQSKYGVSLAKDIDDEWGLDINTVKEHICKKLAAQAKALGVTGIYFGDYQKINDIDTLNNWINNAAAKIRNAMNNATEKYKAGDANDVSPEQKSVQRSSAAQIVADIEKAISGWNDIDALKRAISRIDKPEELKEVNRLLALKGYNTDEKYSPIEKLIYEEANHSAVHTYNSSDYLEQVVQKWISNGTLTGQEANKAQARMAARVIFDGGDGFGTDCEKIKKGVRMIKCPKPTGNREKDNAQAREVYKLVNQILVNHRTFYGLGSPSKNLLDYCKGEMWDSEVKYLNGILAETNAIQGEEKAQAVKELTQEAVEGAGTDIEYLEQAIRAIDSPADRKAVEVKLKAYCEKKGIKPQIAGQSYLQAILYDECDTFMGISRDHKEIRKFNEMLIKQGAYTEQEIINLRAEQAALQILEGDFSNIQDAVQQIKDKRVYSKVLELLKTKHQAGFDDFLTKKLGQEKSDLVYAELAANTILGGTKTVEVVFRLIQSPDFNVRAKGIMAIRTSEVANMVDELLKKKGSSLAKVLEQFNKEKAEYKSKAEFWNGLGKFLIVAPLAETISDAYKENTDSSDNMYVETKQVQNIPEDKKAAYQMTVQVFEQKLEQMKQDYQKALDSQGVVSGALNAFCEAYGIGTTREEIAARIEHDTETLRLLKLAADGKLAKIENGKEVAVSFEAVFKERNVGINFDAEKVENVANQAQRLACMEYAKDNITACWDELSTARTEQQYASAIIDTLEKLSNMSGKKLSLEGLGYSYKNGVIVDKSGKPVSAAKLQEIANQLKQGLADVSKAMLGVDIPLNSNSSKVSEMLSDGYESKVEGFKKEYRDAFGVDAPDSMIEDYISTIETGKTVLNIGVMIGAIIAAPFTGGGSLAVFAMTAGASLGLNALENSTDADGWTNSEWTSDVSQAFWDGALAAVGVKIGQIAETFAKGGSAIVSQNKWLARLPKGKVAEALEKAKDIAYKMQNQAGKIGKGVLEAKKAQIAAKFPNVSTETIEKMSIIIARAEACGFEVSSDTIQSLVQMYCQHGQFDEASFLQAFVLSLGANAVGHAVSAKQAKETGTENLDKATSHGAAHPSNVHVGSKKAEVIRAEVDEALNNPNISGEELARIRAEVEALADRDLRRELMAKIDEAEKKLTSPQKAAYDAAKEANTQNTINHIFEKHSVLNDSDVRVLSDYIKNTNDINVLNELKNKLRQKELTYGRVTANYRKLYDAIDARVKVLTPKPNVTDEAQKSYIHSMLNSDKGLVKEEFEQLMDYIKKIDSEDELNEISRLVNKKKMLGSYKKQLQAAVDAKSAELKAGVNENVKAEEPKADEAKTEEPKTEEPKTDNSTHAEGASQTSQKSYAEMNHEELFAEYYRLKMEVTYSPLNNADKAANINKMKEISVLLEQKGFKIEGDRLVKIKSEAPKSDAAEAADAPKSRFSAAELRQKLGEKLYKAYQKAEELIARVKTMADYEKAKAYIQANFNKFSEVMTDLLDRLKAKARSIGLKFKKAVDDVNEARNARRAAGTAMPDWINSFGGKNSDIRCPKGERVKADVNTRIRLGNKVDIDLRDLQAKLNAMQDGDSFMIGRTVNGVNDICINNEYISGQHLKIEKINGEIYVTDMSTNGTILNSTSPDYAAKWSPDMAGQYNNARSWDFNSKCDKYYDELRMADYSYAESVNAGRITDADINPMFAEFEFVTTSPQNGWSWRKPKKLKGRSINVVDRISLNVKADKNCLRELDMLLEKGEYINSKGQKVKIKVPDAYYKTPQSLDAWGTRHDPITMYFDGEVSKELEDAIAEITAKYARKPSNGKALMNSVEGKPWIAHEAYTPVEDAEALYEEARRLNPELAHGIASWVGKDDGWNCSTGMFAAAQRMVDEYKLSLRQSGNSSSFNHAGRANGSNSGYSGARGADTSHGRTNTTMYQFRDMNDLRYRMADKLNLFSERTQNNIINNLRTRGEFRCQKNGVEYQFVMRGNAVKLEEFDIKTKYDIKETKVDEYNKQTTYQIQDQSDIYWALVYKLHLFSNETQSYIMNKLVNGEVAVLRKGGISYEFSIDANGKITVKEFEYQRHAYETGNERRSNESGNRSRADEASSGASNAAKQERIQQLEDIIARAEDIKKFTDKFANVLSDGFKVTDEAGVKELKKTTRLIKAFWHTDVGNGAPGDLQMLCDELFNMTDGKYIVMGQSRMGTPDEVNGILQKIRELTNIDALKSELERLKQ